MPYLLLALVNRTEIDFRYTGYSVLIVNLMNYKPIGGRVELVYRVTEQSMARERLLTVFLSHPEPATG
jgi:hypothetical protein